MTIIHLCKLLLFLLHLFYISSIILIFHLPLLISSHGIFVPQFLQLKDVEKYSFMRKMGEEWNSLEGSVLKKSKLNDGISEEH